MFRISKSFTFDAAHHLEGLREGHKCGRHHGHTYEVIFEFHDDQLNEHGFVIDYGDLDGIKQWIDHELDHRDLNEVGLVRQPSAENLAYAIFQKWIRIFPQLVSVTVKETPKTAAKYSRT